MKLKNIFPMIGLAILFMGSLGHAEEAAVPAASPAASPTAKISSPGKWSDGWYEGATGYDQAVEEYKQTRRPMVVYMKTTWCPYCRKFEKEVLSSPLVQDAMKNMIKVLIDPETGSREDDLSYQYRLRGFPSFYLHVPGSDKVMRLSTGVLPETFVEFLKQALE